MVRALCLLPVDVSAPMVAVVVFVTDSVLWLCLVHVPSMRKVAGGSEALHGDGFGVVLPEGVECFAEAHLFGGGIGFLICLLLLLLLRLRGCLCLLLLRLVEFLVCAI